MFGIGFQEMLIILVVVLIFFGPKRLPDLAKSLGKGIAEFKKASEEVRKGIDDAMKEETPKVEEPAKKVEETPMETAPHTAPNTVPNTAGKKQVETVQPALPYLEPANTPGEAKGPAPASTQTQG
ncbi:MAG: twin-arginine translocation protein, TatB subunit [Actinobacteria bacterium]|nr:twin-arginine translocation protein, TatB subunit [Actinomycetota bacterium]